MARNESYKADNIKEIRIIDIKKTWMDDPPIFDRIYNCQKCFEIFFFFFRFLFLFFFLMGIFPPNRVCANYALIPSNKFPSRVYLIYIPFNPV